ncbi:Lipase [Auxenochlorella protothecoides]|uniref:Lipase n=1 Tax=Auxenochlorella protothecoides TaxID=3075 RepID=A0A087SSM7_AUXPR|nr:Lipase [Auxenochlorella protothecoides]KFM28731.1 Lipase [Auxenochlorella protothecoides]
MRRATPCIAFLALLLLAGPCKADIFDTIGNALGDATRTVGNAVDTAADATTNFAGNAVSTVGGAIGDAANAVGGALSDAANATGDFVDSSLDTVRSGLNTAVGAVSGAGSDIRTFFSGGEVTPLLPSIQYGPIVVKTLVALQYAVNLNASDYQDEAVQLALAEDAVVTIRHAGLNQAIVAFQGGRLNSNPLDSFNTTEAVPYLEDWIGTAAAPTLLLDSFSDLLDGAGSTNGTLVEAVEEIMGSETPLHIIVTGQAAGGGLAALAGPALALAFPRANVDVITFGMPWTGFNPQFSWAFDQLVSLYYVWPFNSSDIVQIINATQHDPQQSLFDQAAMAVNSTIGPNTVGNATLLPNLPPPYPADAQAGATAPLGDIAPSPTSPGPAPSACPPILCKSREGAAAACLLWRPNNASALQGLPRRYLQSGGTGASAAVAWDAASETAYIVFEGTDTEADWVQDLLVSQSSDFRPTGADVFDGVGVHQGFLNQFESLTDAAPSAEENITAVVLDLSGGLIPRRVVAAGHSLGSGLASLTGVWASALWPNASVSVVGTGTPMVGNGEWVREFRAIVGRANRFVYEIDQVPSLPPIDDYRPLPDGVWFRANYSIAVDRPPFGLGDTSWDDHDCERLYVPSIMNATRLDVPQFVLDLPGANASLPEYATAG